MGQLFCACVRFAKKSWQQHRPTLCMLTKLNWYDNCAKIANYGFLLWEKTYCCLFFCPFSRAKKTLTSHSSGYPKKNANETRGWELLKDMFKKKWLCAITISKPSRASYIFSRWTGCISDISSLHVDTASFEVCIFVPHLHIPTLLSSLTFNPSPLFAINTKVFFYRLHFEGKIFMGGGGGLRTTWFWRSSCFSVWDYIYTCATKVDAITSPEYGRSKSM